MIQNWFVLILVVCFALVNSAKSQLLGIDYDSGIMYSVSTQNASLTIVGNTGQKAWADIQFSPSGVLYGFTAINSTLFSINSQTAATTPIGTLGPDSVFEGGLAFGPNGQAFATNGNYENGHELLSLNLDNEQTSVVALTGNYDINGLAYRSDGTLIGLDRETNSLLIIDPDSGAISTLTPLAPAVGAVGGMTVLNGIGYFNTAGPLRNPGSNSLYSFDLFTGSYSLIGSFDPTISGTGISGLAAPVPEPSTLALLCLGGFGLLRRGRR